VQQVPADHALAAVLVLHELPGEELLVDRDVPLAHLLPEHLDQHVAGDVGGVDGARRAGGAEWALRELAVLAAGEERAPVLELDDVGGRLLGEDLDRVLVAEVVGALDGVVGVDLGVVLGRVPERRVDASLGRPGVRAGRMKLRDHRDVRARVVGLDRGAHASAARADDEHVVLRDHGIDASARERTDARRTVPAWTLAPQRIASSPRRR
jgi:hypothetical protein